MLFYVKTSHYTCLKKYQKGCLFTFDFYFHNHGIMMSIAGLELATTPYPFPIDGMVGVGGVKLLSLNPLFTSYSHVYKRNPLKIHSEQNKSRPEIKSPN